MRLEKLKVSYYLKKHVVSDVFIIVLCFVDRASRYIYVIKTKFMHYLSAVYFFSQPLYVSDISAAHHREIYYIQGVTGGTYQTSGVCSLC